VFEYEINNDDSLGVNIYSFKTRSWIFKEYEWGEGIVVFTYGKVVFVVDMEGKTWRKIHMPTGDAISIYEAQGQLCLCNVDTLNRYELSI
jgi:sugar lactone lactonase YvrE